MNTAKRKPQSLETRIGLFWLHKLGIASLVFGIVFLITYSIQLCANPFLEALLKLGSGLIVSGVLLLLGRSMSGKDNQKWFAHGLTAGGWSLAYFTTYAAHYLPDLRVIDSLPVETLLLSLVATGSLWSALRARSELMAIYSITLATVTILMNSVSLFGDVSFLIIAITASVLGNLQSWRKLLAYALACCYSGHFFCCLFHTSSTVDGIISTTFLSLIWLAFTIAIGFSMSAADKAKNSLTTLACVNAGFFAAGLALFNTQALANLNESMLVVAGLIYLAFSKWMQMRHEEQLHTVHSLLGLFLVNAAKCMHFSGMTMFTIDVFQIALLSFVGLKYKINTFKWVAVFLSALFVPAWLLEVNIHSSAAAFGVSAFDYVRLGMFAAAVFGVLAFVHIRLKKDWYFYFYHLASNVVVGLAFIQIVDPSWRTVAFALLAVANVIVGVVRNSNYYAAVGLVPFLVSIGISTLNLETWLATPMALYSATCLTGHMIGRLFIKEDDSEPLNRPGWLMTCMKTEKKAEYVEAAHWLLAYVGVIALTALIYVKVPTGYISLALGIEGLGLLAAGFILREEFFRLSSLIVLALLTLKLLFVDLANHDTIERILSFIAAGVIFLLSSYAYGRFTRSFEDESEENSESQPQSIVVVNGNETTNVQEVV